MKSISIKRILLAVLAILAVASGGAYYLFQSSDPCYEGKALGDWLADLDQSKPDDVRERAKAVLSQAAREAAPSFIKTLRAKDSQFALLIRALAQKQKILNLRFRTADERREQAVAEFSRFRIGAIPVLTNLLDDPMIAAQATRTLNGAGPEAAVPLIRALDHTNDAVRMFAVLGLDGIYVNCVRYKNLVSVPGWKGEFPTNAAVAALVRLLEDEKPNVRASAAFALGNMREQPGSVIPVLIERLEGTNPANVRRALAVALGKFAQCPITAFPSLERLAHDDDPDVRKAAENMLRKTDGRE